MRNIEYICMYKSFSLEAYMPLSIVYALLGDVRPSGAHGGPRPSKNTVRAECEISPGDHWADLREDNMINPAPDFWPIFGPLGPTAGPGNPGTAPARKIVQVAPKMNQF